MLRLLFRKQGILRGGSRNKKGKGTVKAGHENKKYGIFNVASSFHNF